MRARLWGLTFCVTASCVAHATPTRVAVIAVNQGANPQAGVPFEIQVQTQDEHGVPAPVSSDTEIVVVIGAGTGYAAGDAFCTIAAQSDTCELPGEVYTKAEAGVIFTVLSISGDVLAGNSQPTTIDQPSGTFSLTVVGDYFTGFYADITSDPAGLTCNSSGVCSGSFPENAAVTLTMTPENGVGYSWTGDCVATNSPTCELTLDTDKTVGLQYLSNATYFDAEYAVQSTTTNVGSRTDVVDQPRTEILGHYYEAIVYDETFDAAYSDPVVQAGIAAADDAIRQAAQNPSIPLESPILTASTDTLLSNSTSFEDDVTASFSQNTRTSIGPGVVAIDDLGTMATLGACIDDPTQCPSTVATINLLTGATDLNTLFYYTVDTARTVVTTETHLVAQTYEISNFDYIFADGFNGL